ncbi:NAD(P)H-binding protein [Alkalimonas delamerensis]|uniref:NAD(P)H-binding protein n=1 Tax=Alkalimonas delamerensis TaxID=265981 RepID=A0ABT9GKU9_9GAMM|nr:NAD(P)H-binding protein [Alkalimonas delamerensis]MDP4527598.1 NAD(P)H-binding protein [Alkalimonas delamerensis]
MKIIVVGCGWLGQQLLPVLLAEGHQVLATRRSAEALQGFAPEVTSKVLRLPLQPEDDAAQRQDFSQAVVICAITPGWRKQGGEGYLASLASLAQLMKQSGSLACIHFSSTGVYQGLAGEVDEQSAIMQDDDKASLLYQGEQILSSMLPTCTLRLGGLMGPGRHPGNFVRSGLLADPDGPVNMVHSEDVVRAVLLLLQQQHWPAVFNLCCPDAVSRRQFYQRARALSGQPVLVEGETSTAARRVLASAITAQLGFQYRYSSALNALTNLA